MSESGALFMKKLKDIKIKKKFRVIIIIVIISVAAVFVYMAKHSDAGTSYIQDTAKKQDITVYHSFPGTVSAVNSQSVMSAVSGVKISEVDVKEGDIVKAGDVIAKLDTSAVDEQIKEKEIGLDQTAKTNALSVKSAKKTLDDLNKNINDGLDPTRQGAQTSIDTSYASLLAAANAYNNEVSLNNEQLSSTIMGAIQTVNNAARTLESAQLSTQQAKDAQAHAKSVAEAKGSGGSYDPFLDDQSISNLGRNEETAKIDYDNAVKSYKVATINEESNLTQLFDQLISAQNSYFSTIDSYNATIRAQEQQMEGDKIQIEQAELGADDTLNTLQLADLKKQRDENYIVKAPIAGQITKLNAKAGDITAVSATTSLAKITDYSTMKVDIKVGEYDITSLAEGDDVTVSVPAIGKEYKGRISHIDREATSANGVSYFNAEVEFKADDDIRAGLSAEVKLNVIDRKGVTAVDNSSIMTDTDGSSFVYVKKDGQKEYTKQGVVCGATDGQYTEIKSGLKPNEVFYYDTASIVTDMTDSSYMDDSEGGGADSGAGTATDSGSAEGTGDAGNTGGAGDDGNAVSTGDAGAASDMSE